MIYSFSYSPSASKSAASYQRPSVDTTVRSTRRTTCICVRVCVHSWISECVCVCASGGGTTLFSTRSDLKPGATSTNLTQHGSRKRFQTLSKSPKHSLNPNLRIHNSNTAWEANSVHLSRADALGVVYPALFHTLCSCLPPHTFRNQSSRNTLTLIQSQTKKKSRHVYTRLCGCTVGSRTLP